VSERQADEAMEREVAALGRRRVLLPMALPTAIVALLVTTLLVNCRGPRWGEWWRGERAWTGERQFVPAETPDADAGIDWTLLHQQLLPRWGLGLGWGRGSTEEQAAFDAVFAEARKDPNLARLLLELRAVARTNAARQSRRVEYLGWAWNDYLAGLGVPWYLECNVAAGPGNNRLLIQSYRVQGRTTAQVGRRAYPLLVLERADRVGTHDGALGRARVHDGLGQVLVKGVREQAELWVWPLFDRLGSHANRGDAEFARPMSAEVQAALSPEHYAVLSRTAPSFHALVGLRKSILESQDPGSRFRMSLPPAHGYAPTFRAELERMAEAEHGSACPVLSLLEADRIDLESEALARVPELEAALAALTAHLVRGVAVHEARHVADEDQAHASGKPPRCPGCPRELGAAARAEVSAYLASFADEQTGISSLYQACHVGRKSGANATALGYLLPQLLAGGCSQGPPSDLYARARRLEQRLFNRSQPIALEPDPAAPTRRTIRVTT
jgi:hypothetical protein